MADDGLDRARLREAYEDLDFEMVAVTDQLEVPTCGRARLDYTSNPAVTDPDVILRDLEHSQFVFWDVLAQTGEEWYEFSLSARAGDPETGEDCRVSISTSGVSITTKDDEFTYETFEDLVDVIGRAINCKLEPAEVEEDE